MKEIKEIKELYEKKSKEYIQIIKNTRKAVSEKDKINTDLKDSLKSLDYLDVDIYDYDTVKIKDDKNEYNFKIVENKLRMKKYPKQRQNRRSHGWGHPFEIYEDMMFDKLRDDEKLTEETFWEGGNIPETEKEQDYLEKLKKDILSNGDVSKLIKTYLTEGVKKRKKLYKIINSNDERKTSSEFWNEINKIIPKDINILEPVEGLFNIRSKNEKWLKITFIKETKKQLHFSLYKKMKNGDEKTITKREEKKYFNFSDFIELVTPFHNLQIEPETESILELNN